MRTATHHASDFSLAKTRAIVRDLFTPNMSIYWTDFLGSMIVGGLFFALVRVAPRLDSLTGVPAFGAIYPAIMGVAFVASSLLFYRAALFIHEITHLRDEKFRAFRIVWNLLCGVPFLMPSFMYYTHVDHHMRKHFGTHNDGEYLPLGSGSPWKILLYLVQPFVIAILAVVRFLLLAPLSWISPAFRQYVHRRASSMVMDPSYIRPLPTKKILRIFWLQEFLCFGVCLLVSIRLFRGRMEWTFLLQSYLTSVFILLVNHVRTLGAHRYTNAGEEMTFVDQLLDSVNYPNHPITGELWAPVGLRFHALHHLFPSLPYHNLGVAHRRLMAELPADSPYRRTNSESLVASLKQLVRTSLAARQNARVNQPQGEVGVPA